MESAKKASWTFMPGIVTDLDSSWKRCCSKMKLRPRPATGSAVTSSPAECHGDYFSFDPSVDKSNVSCFGPYAASFCPKEPILSAPTSSDCSPHDLTEPYKRNARSHAASVKSIKYVEMTHGDGKPATPCVHVRWRHPASRENSKPSLPLWDRQVDGMDDVEKGFLPTPPASATSEVRRESPSGEDGMQKDTDGDLILPDADAPQRPTCPRNQHTTSSGSSVSIGVDRKCSDKVCCPPVSACPAIRPVSLPGNFIHRTRESSKQRDRFILPRKSPTSSRESLRLSIPAASLSDYERWTRQRHPTSDPFSRHVPKSTSIQPLLHSPQSPHAATRSRSSPLGWNNPLALRHGSRQVSDGAVWNVGGSGVVIDSVSGIPDGRGGMLTSGTNAPLHTSMFLAGGDQVSEQEAHEKRIALAMGIDQSSRVLGSFEPNDANSPPTTPASIPRQQSPEWIDCEWTKPGSLTILDAPQLRDDFYCSLLAYSESAKCLAVGLGSKVYLWSETEGVGTPDSMDHPSLSHLRSLSFSSTDGGQAILAIGRADGSVSLWSVFDEGPRFHARQPNPISCVAFGPNVVRRLSMRDAAAFVDTEQLLVGDEIGNVSLFSVEWPDCTTCDLFGWPGAMSLIARLSIHTQQVCGLVWSPEGEYFATGGNDNSCFLFDTKHVLSTIPVDQRLIDRHSSACGPHHYTVTPGSRPVPCLDADAALHKWTLNAAVKAMAFCPWQRGLLAVGGGTNDRCIHFYHTVSGACLATIDCSAQVTSLIWSTTRREICATFGFAQPEHPFRIAVFSWPACEQLVAIPWAEDIRALYAIPYPGGPNDGHTSGEGGAWWRRTHGEGCIVVATSDSNIKFHEVWSEERRRPKRTMGLLGGSEILGELHGVEREGGMVIR